jgi:hypothetical protein
MDSFYANMILAIQDRIKDQVPEIRFTEQNFGQYANDDFRAKVSFPALLIDFTDTQYSQLAGDSQMGTPIINIVLLFNPFSQSYSLAPLDVKQKALDYYETEHKVYKALHGWTNGMCQPLVRINDKGHNRNEFGLRIRELNFSTEFEDYSHIEETTVTVGFKFSGEIKA